MLKSKNFWGIITSVLFLWLTLRNIELSQVPSILAGLKFQYVPLILMSLVLEHLTRAVRWQVILHNRPMGLKHAYFATVLGYFFNNILPARAGEFIRAYYLKKKDIAPSSEAFGTVVFERFLDGIITLGIMCFSLQHFTSNPIMKKAAVMTLAFYSLILLAIILIYFKKGSIQRIGRFFFSYLPQKAEHLCNQSLDAFMQGMIIIADRPRVFFKAMLWSVIAWSITLLTHWLYLQMFPIQISLVSVSFVLVVLAIGSMIPSSPGMIGVYEWCCLLALHKILGYPAEIAATFGLVTHAIAYLWVGLQGVSILTLENLSLKELKNNKE